MIDDFTPTTDMVCAGYSFAGDDRNGNEVYDDACAAEFDRWLAQHDAKVTAEASAKIEAVRKYADERAWYARRNTTVDSVRIASDLFHILGLGPDGKEKP